MKKSPILLIAALLLVSLTACGSKTSDRALSGAGIGAGVGAVGGALMGAPATGAAVGAATGAAAGALINEQNLDLGKPIWR
jgi:uncharacterized membrane protein